ncbi:MAG: hypothetical protein ACTHLH_11050 [Solirubrobacterales bacterium]
MRERVYGNCHHRFVLIVAVDWSGKTKGAAESLWRAEVRGGRLTELRNGLSRDELIAGLIELADEECHMVVGIDFAFSFPMWWCEEKGWSSGEDVWTAMGEQGESLLALCEDPFWGRPGRKNPHPQARLYRHTERSEGVARPKSVFQICGAGAVGTGSIRGMPHLLTLAKSGFGIWPFSEGWPRVMEIYPRALTGPINKGKWSTRHAYLLERFPDQPMGLLERAAGSEDAFDAAVSALVMSEHEAELRTLALPADPVYAIEGQIWRPERL